MRSRELLLFVFFVFLAVQIVSSELVFVEGGCLEVGVDLSQTSEPYDLCIESLLIGTTEVTVEEWRSFTEETGYDFQWEGHYWGDLVDLSPGSDCPIQLVRLHDIIKYCNWLSVRSGLQPVFFEEEGRIQRDPQANGFRLPLSDEWEYCARGGLSSLGYSYAGSNNAAEVGWYGLAFSDGAKPVGQKRGNELGLYDMSGNVQEFIWPDEGIPVKPVGSDQRVVAFGGSWVSNENDLVLGRTSPPLVVLHSSTIGFRLARNAP